MANPTTSKPKVPSLAAIRRSGAPTPSSRGHGFAGGELSRITEVPVALATRQDYAREIKRLWDQAQKSFLQIGRYLLEARTRLDDGDYGALLEHELPFGRHVAYQLRRAAEFVDRGTIAQDELPRDYSTVYQLAQLTEAEIAAARERQLIRPDVTRRAIQRFRRELRNAVAPAAVIQTTGTDVLLQQLATLRSQRRAITDRISEVETKLTALGVDIPTERR